MDNTKNKNGLYWLLALIAVATVISGLVQMLKPAFILDIISGEQSAANLHSFAIVGMFMLLFGGLMLHALFSHQHHPVAVFWSGLQKLGAFAAVGLGVMNGVFASIAWAVALFDLASGILILYYWHKIR
ncbi:hypothetical protein [Neptunicella sp. SCSIO 80796]|uniref:hypothetical protein n=1 Tax=Neptunicella plasticusilytica TaxID=3117012 RepID=UPI003A4DA208